MPESEIVDTLNIKVTITSDGTSASLDGGNIKELRLDLDSYGFFGEVRIWVIVGSGSDEFFPLVTGSKPLELALSVSKALYTVTEKPEPLKLSGMVSVRRMKEVPSSDISGNPILYREYTLDFMDVAQALWSEHRPSAVYARTKMEKILAENTPAGIQTKLSWAGLKTSRDMVCLGLGQDEASFYDFMFWLVDRENGHIWYDYSTQTLNVAGEKPNPSSVEPLVAGAIDSMLAVEVTLAPLPRCGVQLLNSRDGESATLKVDQENACEGVRRDYLIHTALNDEANSRQETEKARYTGGRFNVFVKCDSYPEMYLAPGVLTRVGDEFSQKSFVSGEKLRVLELKLHANATNSKLEYDIENSTTEYALDFSMNLEAADDVRWRGPSYKVPRYPIQVEGKVLSVVGAAGDRSYTLLANKVNESSYQVSLPNWNVKIKIPVTPDFMPGHLYFPVTKDSRVFLSLEFDSARIARFLQWGTDVTVPNASQGNQLLLGRNDKSETAIKHWYVDSKPELLIARTNAADEGTITVKEGSLVLEVTEASGGASASSTVSVEPQMQMDKAESSQKSEIAIADLNEASDAATTEMSSSAQEAAAVVRKKAEDLGAKVDQKSEEVKTALQGVSDGIDEQVGEVQSTVSGTEAEIKKLFE